MRLRFLLPQLVIGALTLNPRSSVADERASEACQGKKMGRTRHLALKQPAISCRPPRA